MRDTKPPLSEERITAYVRGELDERARAEIEAAVDREPEWLAVVALLAREGIGPTLTPSPSLPDDRSLVERLEREHAARVRPGARLGRYAVEGPLGRGGMGMVYAAHDPELDRRVALKLLRSGDDGPHGQARLLREARALARLSDRHVITIHDVGTIEGRVFLAMELLEGDTLHAWRSASARSWQDVVAVFIDAGRGLIAAHAAGLVHRDFKPSNVMITGQGRVVVLDFGLAHAREDPGPATDTTLRGGSAGSLSEPGSLTRTGQRVGTPAYMAPEQRKGEPCGPEADQYSYCVALHEALYGRLPPDAPDPDRERYPPASGRLPRRLTRLLTRGLAASPDARHPSMQHLVEQLQATLPPRRRQILVTLGLVSAGLLATWAATRETTDPCTGADSLLAEVWDEDRAAAVAQAIERPRLPWSSHVRGEVDRRLHAYADAWADEHRQACRATRVEGHASEAVLDLRMRCLDRRRRAFAALVEVLADADAEGAARAVQAVDALPSLAGCRDLEALRAPTPLPDPPAQRAEAEALFDVLGRVEALRQSRRYDEARALVDDAVQRAQALGHAPTEADARLAAAWVMVDQGELDPAEAELRAGLHAAERGHHDEAVTLAWNRLAWVVGYKLARHDEGRDLARHAEAWTQRLGGAPLQEVSRLRSLGWIAHEAGKTEEAVAHFERALELAERLPADDAVSPQEIALVLNGLGAAALAAADLERAAQTFSRAGELLEQQLGPDHPDVARVRNNLASLLRGQGELDQAWRLLDHNLGVFEATLGPDHPVIGQTLINLGVVELDLGRHRDAERHANRGLSVLTAAHGDRHPMVSKARTIRGDARVQLGKLDQAVQDFEVALALEIEQLGAEHPSVGIVESNLGAAYYDMERLDEAAAHQQRSIEILEASLGPEHPNVAFVLVSLGLTRRAQGRTDEALALFRRAVEVAAPPNLPNALTRLGETLLNAGDIERALPPLERAHALQQGAQGDPGFAGDTRFALARARWADGRDRAGAAALARSAVALYAQGGDTDLVDKVNRWLSEHPIP